MSNSDNATFRWRTVLEVAAIAGVIYFFLGTPGLQGSLTAQSSSFEKDVPVSKASSDELVYPDPSLECGRHEYEVHVFSTSPLVVYIDGFLSENEAQHLIDLRYASPKRDTHFEKGWTD